MSYKEINKEFIEELETLFAPCKELCLSCGAECCKGCVNLKDGLCIKRNIFCLMHYCDKIEKQFPHIPIKIKQISRELFPEAAKRGININFKWADKEAVD